MLNPLSVALKRISDPKPKRFKVLTCPTHEGYATCMSDVNADFYMITGPGLKGWDFQTRPLPKNHFIHALPPDKLKPETNYDVVLCQNRVQQFPILNNIASKLGLPMVILDHTEPLPMLSKSQLREVKSWRADKHVFITEHNKTTWEGKPEDLVITHGIDTDRFKTWSGVVPAGLSVVNKFPQRDVFCGWELWQRISKEIPVTLVGDNPDLSESINKVEDLITKYGSHRFFLNTSQLSPVPLSLLEAMAVGCPVVSTAKQEIPKIIINGVNGFISNDENELKEYCKLLIKDYELAKKIGEAGRQTIIEKFSKTNFVNQWNQVFNEVYEKRR